MKGKMQQNLTFWRDRGFQRCFFSYLFLFVGTLMIATTLIARIPQKKQQLEENQKQDAQGEKMVELLDGIWETADHIADFLDDTEWVQQYKSDRDALAQEFDASKRAEISQGLNTICASNEVIGDIAILYRKKDTVITPKGWFTLEEYRTCLSERDGISQEAVPAVLAEQTGQRMERRIVDACAQNGGYIVYSRPLDFVDSPRAVVLMYIDKNKISQKIQQVSSEQVVAVKLKDRYGNAYLSQMQGESCPQTVTLVYQSKHFPVAYEMEYTPEHTGLMHKVGGSLLLLLIATLGVFLSYAAATRQYRPIYRMASVLKKHTRNPNSGYTGVQELEKGVEHLCESNESLERAMQTYQTDIREQMNVSLLKGYFSADMQEMLNISEIPFLCDYAYTVFVVQREEDEPLDASEKAKQQLRLLLTLHQQLQQLHKGQSHCEIVENIENNTAIIIEFTKLPEKDVVMELAEALYEALQKQDIECRICVGYSRKGLIGISASYQAAMEAMACNTGASAVFYASPCAEYFYPLDWESQLTRAIREGNEKQAGAILHQLYEENKRIQPGRAMVQRIEMMLYETMHRIVMDAKIPPQVLGEINEPGYAQSLEKVFRNADILMQMLCGEIKKKKQETASNVDRSLVRYVDENVFDPDLSLNLLSDRFGVSNASISRIFKKTAGENFYNYITNKRLERAKELLNLRGYCPSEIAREVGYDNEYSFKRAFQRTFGMSPKDFVGEKAQADEKQKAKPERDASA